MIKNKRKINKKQSVLIIVSVIVLIMTLTLIISNFFKNKNNGNLGKYSEPINENFSFLVQEESQLLDNIDFFSSQSKIANEIMDEYKGGEYSISSPLIKVNPFLFSPQSALLMFKTGKKEKVTITLKGKHDDDLVTTFEASKDHFIPVLGLYGNYDNVIEIETESGKKNTIRIPLKKTLNSAKVEVLENNVKNTNGEFYFGTAAIGVANIAYDNYGEVRWFCSNDYSKGMTMLANGHLLLSDNNLGPDPSSTGGMVEMDMLGYLYREYELEGGYHHDAYEMENGNLLVLTSNPKSDTLADYVVELDRKTGAIVKDWDMNKIVRSIDENYLEYGDITWAWINSIFYDKNTNEILLSIRNRNSVVSLDYDTGDIKWILGNSKYWSKAFSNYLITGVGNNFVYPLGEHSISINENGELSIFNNGYDGFKEKTLPCSAMKGKSSYALVYKLNKENKTAEVIYQYGGEEYYSFALSSYTRALDNHMIFNSGWHFGEGVKYDDPTCNQFTNDIYESYIIDFDKDKNVSVKLKIYESKFEVIKAPIYNLGKLSVKPNNNSEVKNYDMNLAGAKLSNAEKVKYETLTEKEALSYKNYESNEVNFSLINNRISLVGSVPDEMDLKVTMISPKGIAYRFNMKDSEGKVLKFVDLNVLPEGRYYVYVNLDEFIYNTKKFIEI